MFRTLAITGAALAVAVITATAAPAQAAVPTDQPAAQPFTVTCSNGQHALVTLPVPGAFAPGLVVDSDAMLVPYRFDYRWTDAHGEVLLRSEAVGETGPVPADAITCVLPPTAYPDGTSLSFTETAVVR
jgi:hypothetical protein